MAFSMMGGKLSHLAVLVSASLVVLEAFWGGLGKPLGGLFHERLWLVVWALAELYFPRLFAPCRSGVEVGDRDG